jgi:hypothetical protein
VKLVRSKGIGVYFVTQNPMDVPEPVLAQLSNRIQHALRAYTPREQKAVKAAAESFRPNPEFSTEQTITELGVGEALVSTLEDKGIPSMVGRTLIRPPSGRLGQISLQERQDVIASSPVGSLYEQAIDRDSAFEVLAERAARRQRADKQEAEDKDRDRPQERRRSTRQTPAEAAINSFARTVANRLGNAIVRGILGSLSGRRR